MTPTTPPIFYTLTDEAPFLATTAFLPVVKAFAAAAGVPVETADISLAGRVLAEFSDSLSGERRVADALALLARKTSDPDANIIKLPNISASVAQLAACVRELRQQGFPLPEFPETPVTEEEKKIRARYARCLGSAVNPVLREGNSDRRAPLSVKNYARRNPHSMGAWSAASRTHARWMDAGDFYHQEKSLTLEKAREAQIELRTARGEVLILKPKFSLQAGEIIDAMFMSKKALRAFFEAEMEDARQSGLLFSLHVKATMMKVSDPIIFGHCVRVYYRAAFERFGEVFARLGFNANDGMGSLYEKIGVLPQEEQENIRAALAACRARRPELAMVDSGRGVSNFHSPNDVIIDASMPAMIRAGGKMWDEEGRQKEVKAVIPDATFARIYQVVIDFCKENGAFDPKTMGSVPNVGLMARQAEEYGSHDKTFEIPEDGLVRVADAATGETLLEQAVEAGDIWRMCQAKEDAVRDWVKLAVTRARHSGTPVVFWLDSERPHEAELGKKVERYLEEQDTSGLEIRVLPQTHAMRHTLERAAQGLDTIAATGNILRDYLTDLFPILELGTSAKMLSIVPLMAGGGLYETGAGGSAPRHVRQLLEENHLRWDSLGEFLALAASLEELGQKSGSARVTLLAKTLDAATGELLEKNRSPSPKTGELDTRGSQFYLALYWSRALAEQTEDAALAEIFLPLSQALAESEARILEEFSAVQGKPADIGGYYRPDPEKCAAVMRPSKIFNAALTGFMAALSERTNRLS
ncbi:MAG: NADP-dependent isocitrate dehydrogenase [Zoogloeaceae bacterium]|jgi:isocitrate dehydrogenase|nr:NADP-dependent isocitrate dehydrogenase [Zoogloeaceae bacterium]